MNDYNILNMDLLNALNETLLMVIISTIIAYVFGLGLAILLVITEKDGLKPNKIIHKMAGFIINLGRSIPFIILLVALMPFTKFITGTTIGVKGMIIPLSIGAIPFVARLIQTAFLEVDEGIINVLKGLGAKTHFIIKEAYIKESLPQLVRGIGVTSIMLIGYSAMSGAVGGGGLGGLAIMYGYYRFDMQTMIIVLIVIIILVQSFQFIFDFTAKKIDKRRP